MQLQVLEESQVGLNATEVALEGQVDFFNLTFDQLASLLSVRFGEPKYRAVQLYEWVYRRRITDISQMTNIAKILRDKLSDLFIFPKASIHERLISNDGTRKYLLEVEEGALVEAVMIKQPSRMTLCVSSQVGCGMGCAFCRTATMGFRRNLKTSEIIRQVNAIIEDAQNFGDMFSNIVFMGMGEPLHNYKSVVPAVKILTDQQGFRLSGRKITISSVGLVPAIERFGREGAIASIAISLNATTDEVRSKIMPINKAYPLEKLLQCLREYPLKPRRGKITIEYVMLSEINDTPQDLIRLPKLLHGIPAKINLIPYNENAGLGFKSPPRDRIIKWHETLNKNGHQCTIRWSKGSDIKAACGQLATLSEISKVSNVS